MSPRTKTSTNFTLSVPPELRAQLEAMAEEQNRSLANFVTTILIRAIERADLERLG